MSTNFTKYLGFTTEISGHWGSPGFTEFQPFEGTHVPGNLAYRSHTLMGGPRFTMRTDRMTTFAHGLFGIAHIAYNRANLTDLLNLYKSVGLDPASQITGFSSNSFAAAFGGGIDVRLAPAVSLRVIEAEYLLTHFRDLNTIERNNQHNVRVSFGVTFRLGEVR